MLGCLGQKQLLEIKLIKIMKKKKSRSWRKRKMDEIIKGRGHQILAKCNVNRLMDLSANYKNHQLYSFILKYNPQLVKLEHLAEFCEHDKKKYNDPRMDNDMVDLVINNLCHLQQSEEGKVWIDKLLDSKDLNNAFINCIEKILMHKVSRQNLKIFLTYEIRSNIRYEFFNREILASAFGNDDPFIHSFLKTFKIDVNKARGYGENTALHFAVMGGAVKNVRYLLENGADYNICNSDKLTPLALALIKRPRCDKFTETGDECVKLLLLAGADPLHLKKDRFFNGFFFINKLEGPSMQLDTNIVNMLVAQLAICKMIGRPVQEYINAYIDLENENYDCSYYLECLKQLERLKSHGFRTSQPSCSHEFSMFSLLTGRKERIAKQVKEHDRQVIANFMEEYERENLLIPFYREIFEKRIKDIEVIYMYTCEVKRVLAECMNISDANHLVICRIVSYLTLKDMAINVQ